MIRLRSVIIGSTLLFTLLSSSAFAESFFDTFYKEAKKSNAEQGPLREEIVTFVMKALTERKQNPLKQLTRDDVRRTMRGQLPSYCEHSLCSSDASPLSCASLMQEIKTLVREERDMTDLGNQLYSIANSAELAAADEPGRPLSFGTSARTFTSVWLGTGAVSLSWPEAANVPFQELEKALLEELNDQDRIIMRFHFGVLRRAFEELAGDTMFRNQDNTVRDKLIALQEILTKDSATPVEYVTPRFHAERLKNIALWASTTDVGLSWIYPTHLPRFHINPPGAYPRLFVSPAGLPGVDALSYPFSYNAPELPQLPTGVFDTWESPLCSRAGGSLGYLCRPLQATSVNCSGSSGDSAGIVLTTCDQHDSTTTSGPDVCSGIGIQDMFNLQKDGGAVSVNNEEGSPPVCIPGTRTVSSGSLVANACYTAACVKESLNEHSLIGNRNSIAEFEPNSPYQSCMLPDPKLGIVAELPASVAVTLPLYTGHFAYKDFLRQYCEINGLADIELPGLCSFRAGTKLTDRQPSIVHQQQENTFQNALTVTQQDLLSVGQMIGSRVALQQFLPLYEKLGRGLALSVESIADLLGELKDATPPTLACPWSGSLCTTQCNDGKDNDSDDATDFPADFSCTSPTDDDEENDKSACQNASGGPGCIDDQDNTTDYPVACNDGSDNDSDGAADYPDDFSCSFPFDTDEQNPKAQCQDGTDNDGDGKADTGDPGCDGKQDNDERDPPQCQDGKDNDGDEAMDFPGDFSCTSPNDNDEENPKAQCQDERDNDEDGKVDVDDPGCKNAQDNDEVDPPQCSDKQDNDGDGAADYPDDEDCLDEEDNDERSACADEVDNDEDGKVDADDPGCEDPSDHDETSIECISSSSSSSS